MISAGKADRAVLHHYDFVCRPDGAIELSPHGQQALHRIAGMTCNYPVPLIVESTRDPAMDEARRLAVVNTVTQLGLPISPDCVVVAADPSIGLSGIEAEAIQRIREAEMVTGASRVRSYNSFSGATVIPYIGTEDPSQ